MKYLLLFFVFINAFAVDGRDPLPVEQGDIPDNGWYWALPSGGVSGWGLTVETQEGNFTDSGNFVFGAIYTFDENNQPIWYTFSGEYLANPDVYAWREERGVMGTLTSALYLTTGGSCLTCNQVNTVSSADSGLGELTIEWANPFEATLRIGNDVVHKVSRFNYNNPSLVYDISFITKGWWQVYFQSKGSDQTREDYYVAQGLVKFQQVSADNFSNSTFYNENYQYYINTDENSLRWEHMLVYGYYLYPPNKDLLVVIYDPETKKSMLLPLIGGLYDNGYWFHRRCSLVLEGYFKPSKINSVFYGKKDDRCDLSDGVTQDDERGAFAYISYVGHAGDAILNNGVFTFSHGGRF